MRRIGASAGGGVCVGSHVSVCGDVAYYRIVTESTFPVNKSTLLPSVSINIPLSGW